MQMTEFDKYFLELENRALPLGGFSAFPGGPYRPDATAWAIFILDALGSIPDVVNAGKTRLALSQEKDGRIPISSEHPEAFWVTPLAILAWIHSSAQEKAQQRAIHFLKHTTGKHWKNLDPTTIGHDTSLQGWPWIADTHSWVEPTAISLLALELTEQPQDAQIKEALQMLLNRQLPQGGWNYGNTAVFGKELLPAPETTGIALDALKSFTPEKRIKLSLEYLSNTLTHIRTPLSLGWGLLGLGAWGILPKQYRRWIRESLALQSRYGSYDTVSLCVVLAGLLSQTGLRGLLGTKSFLDLREKPQFQKQVDHGI